MHSISKNLKKIRTDRGWTQQQMANVLFVTRQTVSNWENGKSMPDLNMLTDISEKLNIDVNILLYGYEKDDTDTEKNLIVSGVLVLSAVISYFLLIPYISEICNVTFCTFNICLLYLIIIPLFSFYSARLTLQIGKIKNIIPYSIHLKSRKNIRKIITVSIIIYCVLLAPYVIHEFIFFLVSFAGVVLKINSDSRLFIALTGLKNFAANIFQIMYRLPLYNKITMLIYAFMYQSKFISVWLFAVSGIVYELATPVKDKNPDKEKSGSSQ